MIFVKLSPESRVSRESGTGWAEGWLVSMEVRMGDVSFNGVS